jgi:hypothetical protein
MSESALLAASRSSVTRVPSPTGACMDVETSKTARIREGAARLETRASSCCTWAGSSGRRRGATARMPVRAPASFGAEPVGVRKPASSSAARASAERSRVTTASTAARLAAGRRTRSRG